MDKTATIEMLEKTMNYFNSNKKGSTKLTIKHLPTGKIIKIKRQQKNKIGLWYLSVDNVWVYAEDCLIIKKLQI